MTVILYDAKDIYCIKDNEKLIIGCHTKDNDIVEIWLKNKHEIRRFFKEQFIKEMKEGK